MASGGPANHCNFVPVLLTRPIQSCWLRCGSQSEEIGRILRPGGINIYTVRHTIDSDYKTRIHRGEDMYEVGGFIVPF